MSGINPSVLGWSYEIEPVTGWPTAMVPGCGWVAGELFRFEAPTVRLPWTPYSFPSIGRSRLTPAGQ